MAVPQRSRGEVTAERPVAYLSAEYGLHECMPVYSGGLGVLSGDHLRAASDIAMPLVAVGILYRRGYLRQRMEGGVTQRALEDPLDPALLPLDPVLDAQGREVRVTLGIPGATLGLRAWRAQVGRVTLFLLDADIPSNRPEDRAVTHHLYGGDGEYRIRQEIVLGRGAVRLLDRLEVRPSLWHLNEGHGAFAPLERVGALVRHGGLTFDEAREVVRAGTLFTTHTPVPAGHDRFSEDLVRRYFSDIASWAGIPWDRFLALGSTADDPGLLNMTALALQFAGRVNGVSREHGRVSRDLFRGLRPHLLTEEMPVASVTNGVHLGAWTGPEVASRLGAKDRPVVAADFAAAADLPAATLWEARNAARAALLKTVRRRLERTFLERGDSPVLLDRIVRGLDDGALVIGFARRFATYKRADLMLRDAARLRALLCDAKRPVRILLAGKSHPADGAARELLARVAQLARGDDFAGRLILLEDYDIGLGRALVQGVDVWLNTPRPPMEASGTSGMKAAINGVLNLSVADGWWPEGFDGTNGWQIGPNLPSAGGVAPTDTAARDAQDADSLYRLLEESVVPEFFKRNRAGVPLSWVERVRRSLVTLAPPFDVCRMVEEYGTWAYAPLAAEGAALAAEHFAGARALAERRSRMRKGMEELRILTATPCGGATPRPGERFAVSVEVAPGSLLPVEIAVDLVFGRRGEDGGIVQPSVVSLVEEGPPEGGVLRYGGSCPVPATGGYAWSVRVRPAGSAVPGLHDPVRWS
jgi:starch phosphorylase